MLRTGHDARILHILILVVFTLSESAQGVTDECFKMWLAATDYGDNLIKVSLIKKHVLATGEEVTVHNYYECDNCHRTTSMRPNTKEGQAVCAGCGKPHDKEKIRKLTYDGTHVVKKEDIEKQGDLPSLKALRWKCGYCESSNSGEVKVCPGCAGGTKNQSQKLKLRVSGTIEVKKQLDAGEFPEVQEKLVQKEFHTDPPPRRDPKPAREHEPAPDKTGRNVLLGGGIVAAGLAVAGGIAWAMRTTDYPGHVTTMSWSHTIPIQNFTMVTDEDWESNIRESDPVMPVNGRGERAGAFNVRNCVPKEHHKVRVSDGFETVKVPYTDYETEYFDDVEEIDNENGTTTYRRFKNSRQVPVTKYRDEQREKFHFEPVYRQWCQYSTYRWTDGTPARIGGGVPEAGTRSLPSPEVNLGRLQRALPMQRRYSVNYDYTYKGETKRTEQSPDTEAEFLSWRPGEKVVISRRNLGTVKEIKRAEGR